MPKIATILLTHQGTDEVNRMLAYWRNLDADQEFIIAHGGDSPITPSGNECWIRITDPELRTRDHPRERQSYLGVFKAVSAAIAERGSTHVHLAEYDEIPMVPDLNRRLLELMDAEKCDVLGHRLLRVDDTTHPHFLDHQKDPTFLEYWKGISVREKPGVVLSMLGCGSFWKWEVFDALCRLEPTTRIYLELFLPTAAHHLGYRVRPLAGQDAFMAPEKPKSREDLAKMKERGAWRVHPVKDMWVK